MLVLESDNVPFSESNFTKEHSIFERSPLTFDY